MASGKPSGTFAVIKIKFNNLINLFIYILIVNDLFGIEFIDF